jgi:eukaryotic-like serine/threonine-protein kinase
MADGADEGQTAALTRADILVVDDTPANLDLLMGMLRAHGYGVRVATGGVRALAAARSCPPDLVMLDVGMPDLDGYAVCERLKADPATEPVPVIFLSAHDEVLDKVRAFRAGGADYVTKPFHFEEVLARIEHQLALQRLQRGMEEKNRELEQRHRDLVESHQRAAFIFSALSEILPGTVLDGRYRLESRIGSGGFGVVFRATHLALGRPVALKVFQPSVANATVNGLERFRREGMSACRVVHPHAVAVLDSGVSANGIPYLVMELLEGPNLAQELRASGRLTARRCGEILGPVCEVLAVAHAAGIIHRDVKPENIVLHREGGRELVKVVDFGLAKLLGAREGESSTTASASMLVGSAHYMAPERLVQEDYDGRADVYSLGVMLYLMLSGRLPFTLDERNPFALGMMHLAAKPVPLGTACPELAGGVAEVVMEALDKDPARRPEALELARRFDEALVASGGPLTS